MPTYNNVVPLSQTSFSGKLPRKPRNKDVRSREYLTEKEVDKLTAAARKTGRHGHRDATLILIDMARLFRTKIWVYPDFATLKATIFTTSYREEGLFGCHASTRMGPV
jgi:type 1 fimbriae regulatory protein FimB/type 1 fimbriae regulatory protein FimE